MSHKLAARGTMSFLKTEQNVFHPHKYLIKLKSRGKNVIKNFVH